MMVLNLTLKSLIHFEFILVCGVRRWSNFISCMYLSNFSNTTYWIDFPYLIVCSCLCGQVLIYHIGVGLTMNLHEENIGSKIFNIFLNNIFIIYLLGQKKQKKKVSKWNYIKLKSFCTAKETSTKWKTTYWMCEHIWQWNIW